MRIAIRLVEVFFIFASMYFALFGAWKSAVASLVLACAIIYGLSLREDAEFLKSRKKYAQKSEP